MNKPWYCVYPGMIDDPKVAKLSTKYFKFLISLLLLCGEKNPDSKVTFTQDYVCHRLHISKRFYRASMKELLKVGIVYFKNNSFYMDY